MRTYLISFTKSYGNYDAMHSVQFQESNCIIAVEKVKNLFSDKIKITTIHSIKNFKQCH